MRFFGKLFGRGKTAHSESANARKDAGTGPALAAHSKDARTGAKSGQNAAAASKAKTGSRSAANANKGHAAKAPTGTAAKSA